MLCANSSSKLSFFSDDKGSDDEERIMPKKMADIVGDGGGVGAAGGSFRKGEYVLLDTQLLTFYLQTFNPLISPSPKCTSPKHVY